MHSVGAHELATPLSTWRAHIAKQLQLSPPPSDAATAPSTIPSQKGQLLLNAYLNFSSFVDGDVTAPVRRQTHRALRLGVGLIKDECWGSRMLDFLSLVIDIL